MKILQQTITELEIQGTSIFSSFLASIFLTVFGLIWLKFTDNSTTLTCQRSDANEGNCELTRSGLLGSNTEKISLKNLQGAKVESANDGSRVVLLTNGGEVPFTYYYTSWGEQNSLAYDVNLFVKNTQHRLLKLTQKNRFILSL